MAIVLVVEDDALICEVAVMMMEDLGHTTLSAGDVEQALDILRSTEPIDALFTDINLREATLGGCDLARRQPTLRHSRHLGGSPRPTPGAAVLSAVKDGTSRTPGATPQRLVRMRWTISPALLT